MDGRLSAQLHREVNLFIEEDTKRHEDMRVLDRGCDGGSYYVSGTAGLRGCGALTLKPSNKPAPVQWDFLASYKEMCSAIIFFGKNRIACEFNFSTFAKFAFRVSAFL